MRNDYLYGLNLPIYMKNDQKPKTEQNQEQKPKTGKKPKPKKLYPLNDETLVNLLVKKQISPENISSILIEKLCLNLEKRLDETMKIMEKTLKTTGRPTGGHYLLLAIALTHPSKKIANTAEKKLKIFIKVKHQKERLIQFIARTSPSRRITLHLLTKLIGTNQPVVYKTANNTVNLPKAV